jgi:hypothetical protein
MSLLLVKSYSYFNLKALLAPSTRRRCPLFNVKAHYAPSMRRRFWLLACEGAIRPFVMCLSQTHAHKENLGRDRGCLQVRGVWMTLIFDLGSTRAHANLPDSYAAAKPIF